MAKALIAVWGLAAESCTLTTKKKSPAAVGAPLITPCLDRPNPIGNDPDVTDHEYGGTPPATANIWGGYCWPTMPFGSAVVVMAGACAQSTPGNHATKRLAHKSKGTALSARRMRNCFRTVIVAAPPLTLQVE